MHRRMRLGLSSTLLLLMFLVGPGTAFAGPPAESEARAVESFDLLDWIWGWIVTLAGGESTPDTGGDHLNAGDGGVFIDPLGGNS